MLKNKICKILDGEYFWVFFALIGVIIQVISYAVTQDSFLSFISGCAGVLSVVLCSEKKVSGFYFWSFLQIITFSIICYQENLWAKLFENAFYVATLLGGLFIWNKHKDGDSVVPREMKIHNLFLLSLVNAGLVIVVSLLLNNTSDSMPFMDSTTTVTAVIAQILMITRYREQWIFWIAVDIASIVLWVVLGNYYMVIQYVFWTLNCFYGYYKWK